MAKEEDHNIATICLSYVKGLSEKIRRSVIDTISEQQSEDLIEN